MKLSMLALVLAISIPSFAEAGSVTLYDDTDYQDRALTVSVGQDIPDLGKMSSDDGKGGGFSDKASSARFNIPYGWKVLLFENSNYTKRAYPLEGTGAIPNLGSFSDKASSLKWVGE